MAVTMATVAAMMQNVQIPDVHPQVIKLPTPPALVGALSPNQWLAKAKKHAENMIIGPVSMVVVNRYVYTGLQNGWVVEIRPNGRVRRILRMSTKECGRVSRDERACGRPMGIRADRQQYLVVADAYKGIYRINPRNGAFKQLVDASLLVNDKPLGYINDLAITRDGTIFFTSSSSKHNRTDSLDILLEGESTGRVLVFNPRGTPPNHVQVLVSNLRFASGLQLSRDESYLLIGEGARAKIHRAWIGHNSPKRGTIETFADNLPGFVDNIRLSPRNTYWVALTGIRSKDVPSLLDRFGDQPDMRRKLMGMPRSQIKAQMSRHSLVVELNAEGQVIRSLHDPRGLLFSSVSEVEEERGILYLGSADRRFVGALPLRFLPPPVLPDPPTGATNISGNADPVQPADEQLARFLQQVRTNTRTMSGRQLQDVVILLVRRLIEAVSEIRRVLAQAHELREDLTSLKERLPLNHSREDAGPTSPSHVDSTLPDVTSTPSQVFSEGPTTAGRVGSEGGGTIPPSWLQQALFSSAAPATVETATTSTTTSTTTTTTTTTTVTMTTTTPMDSSTTMSTSTMQSPPPDE